MLLRVGLLPEEPLAAAAHFHMQVLPRVRDALQAGEDLILVFGPADYTHRDWRNGVVRGLAREYAPIRVNAIAGALEPEIQAAADYLDRALGVTGQVLPVIGQGAGPMIHSI